MADVTLKEIREFFGMTMPEFRAEWTALSSEAKQQIKQGLSDGTYNY